jgi:hypothetical protein
MNHKHLLSALTVTAALSSVLFLAAPVAAQTVTPPPTAQASEGAERRIINGDRTNFGGDFTLRANETLRGDLAIFGGNVQLERGSIVEGDVALFGGNLNVAGTINGDLVQLGGNVRLQRGARVEGKAERVGGSRSEEPGAFIGKGGTDVIIPDIPNLPAIPALPGAAATADNFDGDVPAAPGAPEAPLPAPTPQPRDPLSRAEQTLERLGRDARVNIDSGNNNAWKVLPGALLITLLAMLIASIAPRNIAQASEVARTQPLLSGGVGLLSLIAGGIVLTISLIFIVTICTNPLIALAAIGIGWTVTARIAGEHVMRFLNKASWMPLTQLMVGSVLMALVGAIPIVGDLLGFAFVAIGLGAFVLTRGGTQAYVPAPSAMNYAPSNTAVVPYEPPQPPAPPAGQ